MAQTPGCCVYTISGAEERSKDPLLGCHQISLVTACLKFTAVNIPDTRQLSLTYPNQINPPSHNRNAKPREVKWSVFLHCGHTKFTWVKHEVCWWVVWDSVMVWRHIMWWTGVSVCIWCQNFCQTEKLNLPSSPVSVEDSTCWCGMWEKSQKKLAPSIYIAGMDTWLPADNCGKGIHWAKPNPSGTVTWHV